MSGLTSRPIRLVREPGDEVGTIPDTSDVVLVRVSDVRAVDIEWLWLGRLPAGKFVIIVGDPGVGKSWLTLDMTARISRGASWPDGGRAPMGDVILLSAEDAIDDTIRPRLDRLGADVTRVHALTAIRDQDARRAPVLTRDINRLERAVVSTDAVLVIIDPVSAYLGQIDSHRDAEVRGVLAPLAALADHTGAAIVGVMHLSKSTQRPALHRAIGSIAFVAAARLVLAVAPDPGDEKRRLIAPAKSNICAPAPTLAYRLLDGRLVWEPEPVVGVTADALLSCQENRIARNDDTDAARLICDLLGDKDA